MKKMTEEEKFWRRDAKRKEELLNAETQRRYEAEREAARLRDWIAGKLTWLSDLAEKGSRPSIGCLIRDAARILSKPNTVIKEP